MSLAVAVNRLTSGLVALMFPLMQKAFTAGGTFVFFSVVSLITVFFYKVVLNVPGSGLTNALTRL